MDKYQNRYIKHQKRKQLMIQTGTENKPFADYEIGELVGAMKIIKNRRSRRVYTGEKINKDEISMIKMFAGFAPSSCDRKAIKLVFSKKGTEDLIGGKGWIHKADKIILLYSAELAYKSPAEKDFMPYLDAGFVAQNVYLITEILRINCCFVNPNHTGNKLDREGYRFCGAIALGK